MKNKLNAAALLALSASLAACSSGGGSSSTPQSTPVVSAEQKAAAEAVKNSTVTDTTKLEPLKQKALKVGLSETEALSYARQNINLNTAVAEENLKTAINNKANRDRALHIPYVDGQKVVNSINTYNSSTHQSGTKVNYKKHQNEVFEGYLDKVLGNTSENAIVKLDGKRVSQTLVGNEMVLVQPYSVVYGSMFKEVIVDGKTIVNPEDKLYLRVNEIAGYAVTDASLPTQGKAVYKNHHSSNIIDPRTLSGVYDDQSLHAILDHYTVDFGGKSGYGSMSLRGYLGPEQGGRGVHGLGVLHQVDLQQGVLEKIKIDNTETYGVKGSIKTSDRLNVEKYKSTDGHYVIGLFGPNAEELAGRVTINAPLASITNGTQTGRKDQVEIGITGVRGDIQK